VVLTKFINRQLASSKPGRHPTLRNLNFELNNFELNFELGCGRGSRRQPYQVQLPAGGGHASICCRNVITCPR
jgi:hypothetical protein